MTYQLAWHVQNYNQTGSLELELYQKMFSSFQLWADKPFVKWLLETDATMGGIFHGSPSV